MTALAGPDEIREHVGAHSSRDLALVALAAIVVGYYGAWLAGDYVGRLAGLVVFGVVAAYLLVQQPTGRAVVVRGLYLLAGLVVVTPVFLNLPVLTGRHAGISAPAQLVFHPGVYVFSLVFVGLAGILAGAGYWLADR